MSDAWRVACTARIGIPLMHAARFRKPPLGVGAAPQTPASRSRLDRAAKGPLRGIRPCRAGTLGENELPVWRFDRCRPPIAAQGPLARFAPIGVVTERILSVIDALGLQKCSAGDALCAPSPATSRPLSSCL